MRRLSTCLSFYNPSVRMLRFFGLACVIAILLAHAQNALPPGTPQAYTLPPDKLAQAKAFAFIRDVLYFASTAATLIVLALLVRFRFGPAVRSRMERLTTRPALVVLLAAPVLVLIITALSLP